VVWRVLATEGWRIVVDSIEARTTVRSSKSSFGGVAEASESGFAFRGEVRNSGDCIQLAGQRVASDGRGALAAEVRYREIRETEELVELDFAQAALSRDAPIRSNLPPEARGFKVYFQGADGRTLVTEGPGTTEVFTADLSGSVLNVQAR
jgi:hypothetical protein